jgi:hypothetical protein
MFSVQGVRRSLKPVRGERTGVKRCVLGLGCCMRERPDCEEGGRESRFVSAVKVGC